MRKMICFILSFSLSLGILSGCAASGDAAPDLPTLTLTGEGETRTLSPSGYSLTWKNRNGTTGGVIADPVHPLDKSVLALEALTVAPEGTEYAVSIDAETVFYRQYVAADIGDLDAQGAEYLLGADHRVRLQPDAVYAFHAEMKNGTADYLLRTVGDTEDSPTENYLSGEEYARWWSERREAVEAVDAHKEDLSVWYASALPALLGDGTENRVCSPLNLYMALASLTELAGGRSRTEMLSALCAADMDTLRERFAALALSNTQDTPLLVSLPGGSVWLRDDHSYKKDTIELLRSHYEAEVFSGRMGSDEYDRALRDWTNAATKDLLREYADTMHLDSETVMELVATFCYKAAWNTPFEAKATQDGIFHAPEGDVPCRMMRRSGPSMYYRGDRFSAVSLGLSESGSMFFFLPDEDAAVKNVIESGEMLDLLKSGFSYENSRYLNVDLSIPRFEISGKADVLPAMEQLGIRSICDPNAADFSPLTDENGIFLSKAEHTVTVSIDEQGVTGAAYTDLGLAGSAMPPEETVEFVLDRPFFFAVTALDSSILFAGTVNTVS